MHKTSQTFRAIIPAGIALAAAIASPGATAQSPAPQGEISIPDSVQIFGNDNPNVRKATAIVNGDIITGTDVDQRLALILAANQNTPTAEERDRLRMQVLRNLIDETLQIQEAKASDITIPDAEIDQTYARVAAQNFNQNTEAMDAYLRRVGSSPASLKRQIRGEIAWQQLLRRNVVPF
ncbi:MAG: SurA N-terminal domain-containing protein, partial [Novosphingobium sp.]|nr:SurA N-terminal domain-containing protein [Novosphingobium sp.]